METDLLLVDDEPRILSALRRALDPLDLEIEATEDPQHAVELLRRQPRVLVTDYHMPVMDGIALLREARRLSPGTVRILLTAGADTRQIAEAINVGRIFRFVSKPWNDDALVALVGEAIEAHDLVRRRESAEEERRSLRMMLRGVRKLQIGLYPPTRVHLETGVAACASTPCEHATGDYVDVLPIGRDRTALVVGDVSGHGLDAAFFVVTARAMLRWGLGEGGAIEDVVARANRLLCRDMTDGRFLTLFAAIHHAGPGYLEYVNAGHVPPFLAGPRGVRDLSRGGLPLGLVADARHEVQRTPFGPNDLLFAFTDGLTEARDGRGEFFGVERVADTLALHATGDPGEHLRAVTDALLAFAGDDATRDDLTLLAYRPRNG